MRIINRQTKVAYTDLAELLRDEGLSVLEEYLTTLYYTKHDARRKECLNGWCIVSGGIDFWLPPDRFTVCPDDCLTKEEAGKMIGEIIDEVDDTFMNYDEVESIAFKYLGVQQRTSSKRRKS